MRIPEKDLLSAYSLYLDTNASPVVIDGLEYSASFVQSMIDPLSFRYGYLAWLRLQVSKGSLFELSGDYYDNAIDLERNA